MSLVVGDNYIENLNRILFTCLNMIIIYIYTRNNLIDYHYGKTKVNLMKIFMENKNKKKTMMMMMSTLVLRSLSSS